MDLDEFKNKFIEIKKKGYIKTHRRNYSGIGKTLEDLLDIEENNIVDPDFNVYILKSARKDTGSFISLFTKAPKPMGANLKLLKAYGYPENLPEQERELHVTIDSIKPNRQSLKLDIQGDKIFIKNVKNIEAYYDNIYIKQAFTKIYKNKLIYVLASNKKYGKEEYFWYEDAYILSNFNYHNFLNLISDGKIKLYLRMGHYKDGKPHNRGTSFKILSKYLPLCFKEIEIITEII